MTSLRELVVNWLDESEEKKASEGTASANLAALRRIVEAAQPKQRLLYLHTSSPSIASPVIGMAQHEPVPNGRDTLRTRTEWPYSTVHDAIIDGWQVIQFPDLLSPYDDKEMSYLGFEFILQKWEESVDE